MYHWLQGLPRWAKTAIFVVSDTALIFVCLWLAFWLRLGSFDPGEFFARSGLLFSVLPVVGACLLITAGMHRIKLSAFESRSIPRIAWVAGALVLLAFTLSYLLGLRTPRSVPMILGLLFFVGAIATRIAARKLLEHLQDAGSPRERVVIYGAGVAGVQLATALRRGREMRPVAFVDDNPGLHGMVVAGLAVHPVAALKRLIERYGAARVLLAIPSLSRARQAELSRRLATLDVEVKFLPSFGDMIATGSLVDSLQSFSPDDLLGRNAVDPGTPEVARTYRGRSVMVTGAGGSIGSELCRQILKCRPSRLVLFEMSEFALYAIEKELALLKDARGVELAPRLGSVCDKARMVRVIAEHGVDVIVHAAAYKHVPMVEENPAEGIRNNVLGTLSAAQAAREGGVGRFILVSTDKAVRPTSVMGATKRLAEIVVQDLQDRSSTTKFALVRFGNVLGSSGSVIPLFNEQIRNGGPVTVTDARVTRYFMTITEAAGLVLLAGAYATGGDVFVLDMGDPVRIRDLADRMIRLSGKTVKDADNPTGDIEIREVGLRPGEKLFEELLIADDMLPTPNDKILRAQEEHPSELELRRVLSALTRLLEADDPEALKAVLAEIVAGYPGPVRVLPIVRADNSAQATPAE
ncbi:MAG: nucleoside-diphosphate sugar epimerase/dehydratase [Pseudomonadota bacterium]